jgi:DnaK suppressor protein
VKKPLKTSSKTAVKKNSPAGNSKAKVAVQAKKASKPVPAKAAPTKTVSKGQPVVTKSAKPVAKPAAKPAAKSASKGSSTPVAKPSSKGAAKPTPKAASKPVAKALVKPAAKPVKAPAKVVAKVAAKPAPKVESKPAAKSPVKAAPKPASKQPTQAVQTPPATVEKNKSKTAAPAPVVEAPVVAADVPARAVRPSARLAQITVPSMAQSVASTAAKASYLQNMPTQVLTPPPFVAVKKDPKLANNWKSKKPDQLTDAEVMAMPDTEYMNDAQLAFFRLKLVQLKQGILANAGETTEHLREDTVVVPDPADRATIEEEHALELRTRDRERKLLKKIEQSIQRIDAGDYGYCDETGEPIGVGRLLARPTANLSLEAQQRRELKQKMFGD